MKVRTREASFGIADPVEREITSDAKPAGVGFAETATRLTREDWIEAAVDTLTKDGIECVRVERLARSIGVTKGSFYWHFKDRDELLEAILDHWRRTNVYEAIDYVGTSEDPRVTLNKWLRMPFDSDPAKRDPMNGLSIMLWARRDERAKKVLEEVDEMRVRVLARLLVACGFSEAEARARGILIYSYMRVVTGSLGVEKNDELRLRCEQLLVGSPAAST